MSGLIFTFSLRLNYFLLQVITSHKLVVPSEYLEHFISKNLKIAEFLPINN